MSKFKEKWKNMSRTEQVASLVAWLSIIAAITVVILQATGCWNDASAYCQLFIGIGLLAKTVLQEKANDRGAVSTLCIAIFILGVAFSGIIISWNM